jgi:hypothetical protein
VNKPLPPELARLGYRTRPRQPGTHGRVIEVTSDGVKIIEADSIVEKRTPEGTIRFVGNTRDEAVELLTTFVDENKSAKPFEHVRVLAAEAELQAAAKLDAVVAEPAVAEPPLKG